MARDPARIYIWLWSDEHGDDAETPDDKAQRAAEAMALESPRLAGLEVKVDRLKSKVEVRQGKVEKLIADVAVQKWMIGFNVAMTVAILFKLFMH